MGVLQSCGLKKGGQVSWGSAKFHDAQTAGQLVMVSELIIFINTALLC